MLEAAVLGYPHRKEVRRVRYGQDEEAIHVGLR